MAFFSIDSPFMKFMDKFADIFFLNLLWVLFSLPLVTMGAATVAAASVCLKMVDDEEGPIFRDFWKAFRENLVQGTFLGLLNAAAAYILWLEWQLVKTADDPPLVLVIAGLATAAFFFAAFVHAWPQVARYRNRLFVIIKNSLRISVRFPLKTLLILVVLVLELVLFSYNTVMIFFGLIVGPMIMIYTVSGMDKRIFAEIERPRRKT